METLAASERKPTGPFCAANEFFQESKWIQFLNRCLILNFLLKKSNTFPCSRCSLEKNLPLDIQILLLYFVFTSFH